MWIAGAVAGDTASDTTIRWDGPGYIKSLDGMLKVGAMVSDVTIVDLYLPQVLYPQTGAMHGWVPCMTSIFSLHMSQGR